MLMRKVQFTSYNIYTHVYINCFYELATLFNSNDLSLIKLATYVWTIEFIGKVENSDISDLI